MLQSAYRVEIVEPEGVGPNINSKRKYGNMISGGDISGKNFLIRETFEYAKERIKRKKEYETIEGFRLFNNLLSSMPMAFNLFYPLMLILNKEPDLVTLAIKNIFRDFPICKVTEIGLEFVPVPLDKYIKDKSAMDAYIKFVDDNGELYIIAIETKYTDVMGIKEAVNSGEQKKLLIETGLFKPGFDELLYNGSIILSQIYRNFLLTERYRIVEGYKDSYSIVLAPEAHPSTKEEINSVIDYLKPEYAYKLQSVALEFFVNILIKFLPGYYDNVFERFRKRYLDF